MLYASVGSIDLEKSKYLNYNPYPDAPEYLAAANTCLEGNGYRIKIGEDYLPSRYPPGLSIAYCWVEKITNIQILKIPYITNYILSVMITIFGFLYFIWKKKYFAAFFFPLVLTTLPIFIVYARAPMSEMLSTLYILILFFLLIEYLESGRVLYYLIACCTLGVSFLIRSQNLFFGFLLLSPVFRYSRNEQKAWKTQTILAAGFICFVIGLIPSFYHAYINFGSIFLDGYKFWVGSLAFGKLFSLSNIGMHQFYLLSEIFHDNKAFTLATMFGVGVSISFVFAFISLLSSVVLFWKSRIFRKLFCLAFLSFLAVGTYMAVSPRFYVTHFILLVFVIANVSEILFRDHFQNLVLRWTLRGVYIVCAILLLVGFYPVRGSYPINVRFTTAELILKNGVGNGSYLNNMIKIFDEELQKVNNKEVLLVSGHSPVLLDVFLPNNVIIVPDSGVNQYMFSAKYKFRNEDVVRYVEEFRKRKAPVYLFTCTVHKSKNEIVNHLQLYKWSAIYTDKYMSLYKLVEPVTEETPLKG